MRIEVSALLGKRRELRFGLVGERIASRNRDSFVAPVVGAAERDRAVVRPRLVRPVTGQADHVDDGLERAVEQYLERGLGLGAMAVGRLMRAGRGRLLHGPEG